MDERVAVLAVAVVFMALERDEFPIRVDFAINARAFLFSFPTIVDELDDLLFGIACRER